ncbi:hypothetical protein C0J52_00188 [Blattella germanica]|nr:hypothetical protein C0J52_00188 [Blattella germanica]
MNSITDSCLCLAFENGDVVTLDINSKELECVGCVESGLKTVEWSPDQEAIVMVTGLNTLIVMTGTFDPIIEVDCNQSGFGEKQFITVGWGKKETQFHGSEGKAAARQVKCFDEVKVLDDFKPNISWRGDGSLFAVSTVMPNTNIRQIRIFSRDGILQYTSESVVGLEGALCWRPSGNLIATSQRLPNKHVIAFFEKNGLRHGEFLLPFAQNDCKINKLSWNSESSILLVWAESTNGSKLLMTSFRRGIVPPPMCSQTLQLPLAASHIMFGPLMVERMVGGKEADINSNALAVVLYDGTIMTFRHAVNEKKHIEPIVCNLDYKNPTDLHHWIWLKEDLFLCCFTKGKTSYILQLLFDLDERKITTGQNFATGGIVVSMVRRTNDSALVQLEDGSLYIYKPDQNEMVPVHKCNPEACETLQVCEVDEKNVILGLSSRNRLYVDGEEVANNVTSVLVHSEFILLTTLKHMLLCAQLNQKGLQSLIEGKCGPGRHIERGARLVISVPGDTRVVLQMPRGNLECIQPRPLTLHKQTDKDLADALLRVKAVREAEKKNCRVKVSADEALRYLLYLVDVNRLYDVALGLYDFDLVMLALALFEKGNSRYIEMAKIYGDYLMDSRQYQEAGVMYTRAGKLNKALTAYLQAGDWRATLLTAKELQYKENKLHELCQDVVTRLKIKSQFKEAAEVLKTHVKPGVMEHLKQLSSQLTSNEEQFIAYRNRLSVVRNEKAQRLHEDKNCDRPEECDLYSDTSSIMASSVSARSSRSSKNRRKQERKMLSLKEGSPYEEYALIRALHQLISAINTSTEEVHNLCRILLKFEMDVEAANLQKLLSNLLHSTDLAKQEIWTPNLMQESQVSFGPDATVNSITSRLQTSGPAMPGLTLLGKTTTEVSPTDKE